MKKLLIVLMFVFIGGSLFAQSVESLIQQASRNSGINFVITGRSRSWEEQVSQMSGMSDNEIRMYGMPDALWQK
jgi:hypothetical protein